MPSPIRALVNGALLTFLATGGAAAETTPWMTMAQLEVYYKAHMANGRAYATGIECGLSNVGAVFRMTTQPFSQPLPFYRWNWVHAPAKDLAATVGRLRRSDRLDLKYQIVDQHAYRDASGAVYACAIVYR